MSGVIARVLQDVQSVIEDLGCGLSVKISPLAFTALDRYISIESQGVILVYAGGSYDYDTPRRFDDCDYIKHIGKTVSIVVTVGLKSMTDELRLIELCEDIENALSYKVSEEERIYLCPVSMTEPLQDDNLVFWRQIKFEIKIQKDVN